MKLRALASLLIIAFAGVRAAPAQTVNWTNDLSGKWENASNWSAGALPGPASNVVIDRGAANPVVTLSSGNITVNTLNTSEAFVLRQGTYPEPLLTLNGPSRFGSTLDTLCCFLNSSSTIDIVGRWTIHSLRLSGAGTTTAAGGIDINASGQFFIEGGHTVVNSGTARIVGTSSGIPVINFLNGGTFRNLAGGVFDFQASGERSDITVLGLIGSNRFENHGTIRVSGSGGGAIRVPLISTGLIDVQAGTFGGNGTISGEVRAAPGTLVDLGYSTLTPTSVVAAAGARVFLAGANPASRATVAGTLTAGELNLGGTVVLGGKITATRVNVGGRSTGAEFTSADLKIDHVLIDEGIAIFRTGKPVQVKTLTIKGNGSNYPDSNLADGIRAGTDTVDISGIFDWQSGSLAGPGTTNARGGITLGPISLVGASNKVLYDGHTLNNFGVATWTVGDFHINKGAVFNNKPGAIFDIQQNLRQLTFSYLSPLGTFDNEGLVRKSAGEATGGVFPTPSANIDAIFNNRGTVEVNAGLLRLRGSGTSTGNFKVAAGNMIEFAGGHLLQPSSSVDAIDATVMFSAHNQDQVLGTFRASNTRIAGNALFTGGSPEFGAIDMQGGALELNLAHAKSPAGLSGSGLVNIGPGASLQIGPGAKYLLGFGTTIVDGVVDSPLADIGGGVIAGAGTLTGSLKLGGELRPGTTSDSGLAGGETGEFAVHGDFTSMSFARIAIDIAGTTAGHDYDVLAIGGNAALGGHLIVALQDGFIPVLGDSFTILTFASRSGALNFLIGETISASLKFVPVYSANSLTLQVAAVPEPKTWATMAAGLMLLLWALRRRWI